MSLRRDLASLPREAWVLFAGTLVNRFGGFVLVFLVLYLTERGFTPATAGLVASAYGLGGVAASIVGGHLADHIGRRRTIALSMFAAAVALLALSQARPLWLIAVLTAVTGTSAEMYRPAASALLTDVTAPEQRVTAFAVYRLAVNLGFALGPTVGGLLAERSFLYLFIGDALTSVVFGVIALTALPARPPGWSASRTGSRRALAVIFADARFLLFLAAAGLVVTVVMQFNTTLALQVTAFGFSKATYGALISLNGLLVILVELPVTSVTRRRNPYGVMALGMLLVGAGFGLTGAMASLPFLAVTVVVWTMGEITFVPVASAHVANLAPEDMRGRYMGAWGTTFAFGLVVGPVLGMAVYGRSPALLWGSCWIAGAVAAGLVLLSARRRARGR